MSWFDSHCHLKGFWKQGVLNEVLDRADEKGVAGMVTVGTTPDDWTAYKSLVKEYPETIFYTAGLHPSYVDSAWSRQVDCLSECWSSNPKPVAVGEIGLDYFRLPKDQVEAEQIVKFQKRAFTKQLSFAKDENLPVIVHSRNAFEDCLELIDESGIRWDKVVFHCFSEGIKQVEQLIERGGLASFTGILTFKRNEELRAAAVRQGMENLMIETDSPYLAPEPKRGQVNEPAFLAHVGEFAAELFNVKSSYLADKTFARTKSFYGI